MLKIKIWMAILLLPFSISYAQTTAMQFKGSDCNGNQVDLYEDLDSGIAVILHFYMPSCGSCPPPAQKIQKMAKGLLSQYPGKIKAYAFPFENVTTCSYSASWVSSNNLSLYTPMDSGEAMVAHYGGFGMPTIVLLGGKNHQVLFSTQSFSASDTSDMKNEILKLLNPSNSIASTFNNHHSIAIYSNPADRKFYIEFHNPTQEETSVDIYDISGKKTLTYNQIQNIAKMEFDVSSLPSGIYWVRLSTKENIFYRELIIQH